MCIDFTDLNKAYPKDDFPLPRIDKFVDDAANSQLMSLLDCFSGYHQIWMKREDKEKNKLHNPIWNLLLRKNARRFKKYWTIILKNVLNSPGPSAQEKRAGLR